MSSAPSGGESKQASLSDSAGDRNAARAGLIGINNLNYRLEPDMSVAVNCTDKNHFFQQQKYLNTQRAVCVLNSGADYIDPRRSYLCFTIKLPDNPQNRAGANGESGYGWISDGPVAVEPFTPAYQDEAIFFGRPKVNQPFGEEAKEFYGSAINLIHSITISTRSGDELSRIERLNLLQYVLNPWTRDKQWNDTVGMAMGQNRFFMASEEQDVNRNEKRLSMRVAIPMYCLSGLFNYDKLLPSMLMSGLRIEIAWAAPQTSFVRSPHPHTPGVYFDHDLEDAGTNYPYTVDGAHKRHPRSYYTGTDPGVSVKIPGLASIPDNHRAFATEMEITSYEICDPYFQLKSIQLTDSVQRILNETSAVNGLEIVYTDINNTQAVQQPSGTTGRCTGDFYMEVRHAASRALRALLVPRIQYANNLQVCDSFATIDVPFKRWHWRLGSLYFPHQPIKGNDVLEVLPQTYAYTADAWGKIAGAPRCEANLDTYTSNYLKRWTRPVQYMNRHDNVITNGKASQDLIPPPVDLPNLPQSGIKYQLASYDQYACCAPIAVSLERSTLFNLSGIPINNSRVLSFHGEFLTASGTDVPNFPDYGPLVFDVFLQYVRLARVFLNNVEVEQ